MPRPVPQPSRADLSPEEQVIFDETIRRHHPDAAPGEDTRLDGYHGTLLNSPPFSRLLELGGMTVRTRGEFPGSYSHADRELVDMVLAADMGASRGDQGTALPRGGAAERG